METKLGKISKVEFGLCGCQECELGLWVCLDMKGSGVQDTKAVWDANKIKHTDSCKWTEESRNNDYAEIMRYVSDLLAAAKVDSVSKLKDIPVEVKFEGMQLKSWRILSEVL